MYTVTKTADWTYFTETRKSGRQEQIMYNPGQFAVVDASGTICCAKNGVPEIYRRKATAEEVAGFYNRREML